MMLSQQDPKVLEAQMMQNPEFKQFVESNKGKSIDEICRCYGINKQDFEYLVR